MKKLIAGAVLAICVACRATAYAADVGAKAAIVTDALTGDTYYEQNADEVLAPASMTKLMTVYIVYEKMAEGILSKDTVITADDYDEAKSNDYEASNVPLTDGKGYTVDELLDAIVVPSACAASAMVGRYVSGSEAAFAELMNEYVGKLGLEAYFEDASGLSDNDRMSARSMAKLARELVNKYPDVLSYTSKPYIIFGGVKYRNTNKLLPGGSYEFFGADGLKTGTTELAGDCLTGTAVRDGIRLVSVVMGADGNDSRFGGSAELLSLGFERANMAYNNIFITDMRLYINRSEVPAFYYGGPGKGLYFIIDDLKDYGFDIVRDEDARRIKAVLNPSKRQTPIPMEYYRSLAAGSPFMSVDRNAETAAEIICGDIRYEFENAYSLGAFTAVSADELINAAKSCVWDPIDKSLNVTV